MKTRSLVSVLGILVILALAGPACQQSSNPTKSPIPGSVATPSAVPTATSIPAAKPATDSGPIGMPSPMPTAMPSSLPRQEQTLSKSTRSSAVLGVPAPSHALSGVDSAALARMGPKWFSTGGSATVNDAPYDATFFKNYGTNPFIDTEDDHLSTFATDVDTASYAVARRFIMDGHLPDPDSVRVEEFINNFDQAYDAPAEGAFAIHIEGAPSPFGSKNHWLMRVGLQGRVVEAAARQDASLVFVIDVSGSMARENRLGLVKRALRLLVDELRPTDQVGIVVYGTRGRVVLEPISGEYKESILEAINALEPEGATNAEQGLRLAYEMAGRLVATDRITRVILLSDGVANVGHTGSGSILDQVAGYVDEGITLSTIGFGMGNYNDVLMERLANDGNGNYAYVDTLSQAKRIFVDNLTGMLQVIAKETKVQVDFNPEVVSRYRLLGYENRRVADSDFRNDTIDAGEVGAGHTVTALYELKLHQDAEGKLATVYLRYEEPDTGEVNEISQEFHRSELTTVWENASPRFKLSTVVAEYAEVLRNSYWAQDSSLRDVRRMAEKVSELITEDPDVTEFISLVDRAEKIAEKKAG